MSYTLKASLFSHDVLQSETILLPDPVVDNHHRIKDPSFHATMDAIMTIMERAESSSLWAYGRIELSDPDGEVIHFMASKQQQTEKYFEDLRRNDSED